MVRTSSRKQKQQPQDAPADDGSSAITKEMYDAVVARVAELESEVAVAEAEKSKDAKNAALLTEQRDRARDVAQREKEASEMAAELAAGRAKDALAAAVKAEKDAGAAALASAQATFDEKLASARAELAAEQLARQEAEARTARRTSGGSAKKPRKSNSAAGEDKEAGEAPDGESAARFLARSGGVRVPTKGGPGGGVKVPINPAVRPFTIEGSGAEEFFKSINVTDKASLHAHMYESGYVWVISEFKGAQYNADETKPCKFRDVLECVQDGMVYSFGDATCKTRKVWLAMHLWPDCDALKDQSIKNLAKPRQSLLKKYITGINQMINAYNAFYAGTEHFTPLVASADAPQRGMKRAREDEEEGAETEPELAPELQPEAAEAAPAVGEAPEEPAAAAADDGDEAMPEQVGDDDASSEAAIVD